MFNNEKLEKILGQTPMQDEQENTNAFEEQMEFDKLKTKVLKYIMYKKRTEQEIKRKFAQEDSELLENVVEHLKEIGYINDNDYIKRAVSEHLNINNLTLKELRYKLISKGIKANDLEDYIYAHKEELDEYEVNSAKNIILKKQNSMDEQSLIQYLLKKGYRMDCIKQANGDV